MNKVEKGVVPALRFPEFLNDSEWKSTELGKNLLKHPEYGIGAAAVPYSENLPTYLRITDISVYGKFKKENKVSVVKKITEDNYLNDGDIVFARTGASVGKSYKYRAEDGKLVFAGFLIRVKPDSNKLNSELLFQFVSTEQYWQWVKFVSARSGQPGINGNQYASMPILLPPKKKEQQKIAHCLSSLDTLLTAETEKIDYLKDHKKGLLQQLFPANGETKPQYRFPEFKNDGDWKKESIGKIGKPLMCKRIFKEQTSVNSENAIPFYKIGTFGGKADAYIPVALYNDYKSKYSFPNIGDILISASGTIGRLVVYDGADAYFQDSNIIWIGNDETQIINSLLFYCYSTLVWQTSDGGVIKRLYNSNLKEMEIYFPKNPKEQQKIAKCLSSADDLIAAKTTKIEALKEHKKGLLQQLFPTVNELAV